MKQPVKRAITSWKSTISGSVLVAGAVTLMIWGDQSTGQISASGIMLTAGLSLVGYRGKRAG